MVRLGDGRYTLVFPISFVLLRLLEISSQHETKIGNEDVASSLERYRSVCSVHDERHSGLVPRDAEHVSYLCKA